MGGRLGLLRGGRVIKNFNWWDWAGWAILITYKERSIRENDMTTLFHITKTREYVWRIGPFGNSGMSSHSHITCWHVEDENGNRVIGGHRQGSNCSSGEAVIPRKKDAKAWVAGYQAAESGQVEIRRGKYGAFPVDSRRVFPTKDQEELGFFEAGAMEWASRNN